MFLAASSFLCFCFQKKTKLVVLSTCIFIPAASLSSLSSSAYNVDNVDSSALLPFLRHLFLNLPFFHTPVIFLLTACIFVLENPGVAQPTQASAQQMAFYYPRLGYGYTLVCVLFILASSFHADKILDLAWSPPRAPSSPIPWLSLFHELKRRDFFLSFPISFGGSCTMYVQMDVYLTYSL